MDDMGNLPIYPLGKGGKKSWQLARSAVMIEVVGMMLIMRTNNKRLGQEEQYPPPFPPHLVTLCPTYSAALLVWFKSHCSSLLYVMYRLVTVGPFNPWIETDGDVRPPKPLRNIGSPSQPQNRWLSRKNHLLQSQQH